MTIFCSTSADFCSPPAVSTHKCISGGGKQKSADVKRKTVTLIYPDPYLYKYIKHSCGVIYTCEFESASEDKARQRHVYDQGTLTEGEGSVQLTSS